MDTFKSFESQLYSINDRSFEDIALQLFRFQSENNPIYKRFIEILHVIPDKIHSIGEIPFLPIAFFKTHSLKTGRWNDEVVFKSSGTTSQTTSSHHIRDLSFYLRHSLKCFEHFFGRVTDYHFLALLPSYLERKDSSLVSMMNYFIEMSGSDYSGFYLDNIFQLLRDAEKLKTGSRKVILWGVTFALLELAEQHNPDLSHCLIFETGGMKGRRNELTRQELHSILKSGLNVREIHSEYGMTELLSQCYTRGAELFYPSPWIRIIGRDLSDPFEKGLLNETAGINVVDLANFNSIAFIETEDIGKIYANSAFEVMGRMDNSDIRGCNLLVG